MRSGFTTLILVALSGAVPAPLRALDFDSGQVPSDNLPVEEHKKEVEPPVAQSSDWCAASVTERNGVVDLVIDDAARADQQTTITIDDLSLAGHFDHAGHLEIEAPLLHRLGELTWSGRDGHKCYRHGIVFLNYQTTFEIALIWDAQATMLALHAVEPSGRVGGSQFYVSPERPDLDNAYAFGHLQTFGESVLGTKRVQLYSLPADRNPREGSIYALIEFASRGNPAHAPFCGGDALAVVSYEIIRLQAGTVERRKARFGAVTCGSAWAGGPEESGYFQMWKYKL